MGQALLVQSQDPEAARQMQERACEMLRSLFGTAPHFRWLGDTALAGFQPLEGPSGESRGSDPPWAVAAGAWLHPGSRGEALAELSGTFASGGDLAAAARRFEGFFLLAAGDTSGSEAAVITNRLGTLHAYSTRIGDCLLICTSAVALAALRRSGLDPEAARELLCTGSVLGSRSLFEGVEKLEGGSVYRLRGGRITARSSWFDLRDLLYGACPAEGGVESLAEALTRGLQEIFRSYRRPLLDLTGGIDTRNILAAARRLDLPVATVVNGYDGDPDVVLANRIARELGLDHRQQMPGRDYEIGSCPQLARASALTDGELSVFDYAPVAAIQERTTREFDVSVGGTLGEVYHGSGWHQIPPGRGHLDIRRLVEQRFVEDPWADRLTRGRFPESLSRHFEEMIERTDAGLEDLPLRARADYQEILQKARWAGRMASATLQIRPCLAPFTFERVLRESLSAPPELRLRGRMAVALAHHLDARLAALPLLAGFTSRPHPLSGARRVLAKGILSAGGYLSEALVGRLYPSHAPGAVSGGRIWTDPELADLLEPHRMRTLDLYDERFLRSFLSRCRKRRSQPAPILGRILSLELAMELRHGGGLSP